MEAAFLTYEGIASDPVKNYLDLEQPVWLWESISNQMKVIFSLFFHSGS